MALTPIILCGGTGTRLWPVSRKAMPKQFVNLTGDDSLFVATAKRLRTLGYDDPLVVTGDAYRFVVREQLHDAGIPPAAILIEPEGRNTAPAILAAALQAARTDPEAMLLVAPSDHLIHDEDEFGAAVARGVEAAQGGALVTFGITPARPETGYGYLQLAHASAAGEPVPLARFVEKPDVSTAGRMLAEGNYLWNAGIFLFKVDVLVEAYRTLAHELLQAVEHAVADAQHDLDFLRLAPEPWGKAPSISIDYAIMEKARNLMAVPYGGHWSDLGDWYSLWREAGPQKDGVVTSGHVTALECSNSYLRSESDELEVVGIGLTDTLVVATPDAVLVANKSHAQDVKKAVDALKLKSAKQAEAFPRDHRPWGWYEVLALSDRFQVKRIVVKPGAALSLQSHAHRSEHWIVVSGTARVTIDEVVTLVSENQSAYIPLGSKHRLENPGRLPMVLIEVQTGAYLGEDDIKRYEDLYKRS